MRKGSKRFYELIDCMADIHQKKNSDYATDQDPLSNFKQAAKGVGITPFQYCMARVYEKMARLEQIIKKGSANNEGMLESTIDIANLVIIAQILWEQDKCE